MAEHLIQRSTIDAVLELAALDNSNWEHALQRILRVDSQTLAVDRTSFWKLWPEPRMICCELGYVGSANAFEQGASLLATDAPSYLGELDYAKVICVEDVASDPRTSELRAYCRARNISSMLDVPVWVESKLVGVLCHEHIGPLRPWAPDEVEFALSVAQIVATALEARRRTEAEQEAHRACLLAHASLLMGRSLDERVVAERAVAAALPLLADWAAIDLFGEGRVERIAIQHADPGKQALLDRYTAECPVRADDPGLTAQARRLNQSVLVSETTDQGLRTFKFSEAHIRWLHTIGVRSVMAVLLRVPESIDAVMMFVSDGRAYDYRALRFAEEYGERVAAALNNARLYRQSQEALRARDEFLTLAAHELRTPLTSLRMSCERLSVAATSPGAPGVAASAERILRQSRRLTKLVNRMLDASVAERNVPVVYPEDVDLVPLVREVVDELALVKRGATIDLALPASVVGRWDGGRLQQVISNLIDNALKYGRDRPVRVALTVEGGTAVLSVEDQGIGIDAEVLPHLFEPYERGVSVRGYGGLGLGLFISRQIIGAHGGSIEIRSEKGIGSCFRVLLPGVLFAGTN